jgi:hypothetical protein
MMTMLLPELRLYLEQLLDDVLTRTGITINQMVTREGILCQLQEELFRFIFTRLMAAFPSFVRGQFVALLEEGASNEVLQDFTERHISDIPAFVTQIFLDFRAQFVH